MTDQLLRVRIWDLPTRLFHLALIVSVAGAWVCAQIGGNAMQWHFRFGYAVVGLLIFRIVWGVVGGRWSRFAHWIVAPAALVRYLRGQPKAGERFEVGHSPAGVLSVLTLLGLLLVQVGTGLVADDDIANVGPLNRYVSGSVASVLTATHRLVGQWVLPAWIGLHIAAVMYYQWVKRRRLIGAMISGDQWAPPNTPPSADDPRQRWLAALIMAAVAAALTGLMSLL